MHEIRTTLERIERRVPMPEPAMERLLRRRERKERNERIAAAVVGLGVAAAGLAGVLVTLRVVEGTRPATEGGAASTTEGGGFVLPTVAIWTAIVVLGLTVLAAVRLRAWLTDVDVEQEGREPGGAAASARRPAAAPGSAPWKGGSEMDSKPKTPVGIPQAEMPPIHFDEGRVRRTNRWLVGAVVVLAVAVVALGVALIVQSDEEAPAPPEPLGLASAEVVQALDAQMAALNAGDREALAGSVADDAVVTDTVAGMEFEGVDEIVDFYIEPPGTWNLERVSEVVRVGDFSAFAFTYYAGSGVAVFRLDGEMKIVHQWIMGTNLLPPAPA